MAPRGVRSSRGDWIIAKIQMESNVPGRTWTAQLSEAGALGAT